MNTLAFLTNIAIVLFIGLLMGLIARKLKLPAMLLLIIAGAILKIVSFNGSPLIQFSDEFLISASILALVMIVFEGSSSFSLHDLDTYTGSALKIVILFLVLNMLVLSIAVFNIFSIKSMILCMIFAAVMSGTDPGSVISLFHTKSSKVIDILKFESILNTPVVVLIPFILLNLLELDSSILGNFVEYFSPFMQQIITGIGTGVFFGLIVFRFMRKFYSDRLSPLMLITSSLLTYILAEFLKGNGVLAVTVFGIFFGNVKIKGKPELKEFSNMLSNVLEILVFILIGFLLPLDMELVFILKSLLLFFLMLLLRFIAIELVYLHDHVNLKERIFMSLNCTKGIAVAVVAFILSNYILNFSVLKEGVWMSGTMPLIQYPGAKSVLDLMVLFLVYSIVISSVVAKFSHYFIKLKVEE